MAGDMNALPLPVIQAAMEGDGEALAAVLNHSKAISATLP